ncbi:ATP-binding protein [Methylobacterium sp. Leaf93]|uniref:ATP-dependent nuclease n=1 Tax=Methylobacterium sp. Leaf93 TaxID=1736249 RepID=UPI0009E7A126|nr:ATP-binding protein [Methylobacterium sp. Leaf93]
MPFIEPNIDELLKTLERFRPGSPLDKFIGEAVFPNFKNIAPHTRIKFEFPITALVGANGTGKSSILHALWGMPMKYSTARFWFSTAIDPIDDGGDAGVPRYFYKHWIAELNQFVETKKVRGKRRADYWEPARALESDGMAPMPPIDDASRPFRSKERWNPTERPVKYINFKCEFSAFDRNFYYPYQSEARAERQKRFQNGARRLKTVMKYNLSKYSPGGKNAVFVNRSLSEIELSWVSYILGREYIRARYVLHGLYGRIESPSVFFERTSGAYSEAFAGSGELAVVRAVMEVVAAANLTLVLLDEPETSLHPGAQVRLLAFLMKMTVEKHLQIVISTHSSTIVESLPRKAIKVLEDGPDGRARVVSVTHPQVAFNRIGHLGTKILLAVEDVLLKALVEIAMKNMDAGERSAFQIFVPAGGADAILTFNIPNWIHESRDAYVMLDGDKIPSKPIPDPDTFTPQQKKVAGQTILELFNVRPIHCSNSLPDNSSAYLKWASTRVFYLDAVCPEFVILEVLSTEKLKNSMTNQEAKSALIAHLEKEDKPHTAQALEISAHWLLKPSNPHIMYIADQLREILRKSKS